MSTPSTGLEKRESLASRSFLEDPTPCPASSHPPSISVPRSWRRLDAAEADEKRDVWVQRRHSRGLRLRRSRRQALPVARGRAVLLQRSPDQARPRRHVIRPEVPGLCGGLRCLRLGRGCSRQRHCDLRRWLRRCVPPTLPDRAALGHSRRQVAVPRLRRGLHRPPPALPRRAVSQRCSAL